MRTEEEIKDFLKFLKVFEESSQEIKIMMGTLQWVLESEHTND